MVWTIKEPTFLVKQRHGYCFRINVPENLWDKIGLKEIRYSLKTTDYLNARATALPLGLKLRSFFSELRSRSECLSQLTPQTLKRLIKEYVQRELDKAETERLTNTHISPLRLNDTIRQNSNLSYQCFDAISHREYSVVADRVDEILSNHDLKIESNSLEYNKLSRELIRAISYVSSINTDREQGIYDSQRERGQDFYDTYLAEPFTALQTASVVPVDESPLLSEMVNEYLTVNSEGKGWTTKTYNENKSILKLFQDWLGKDVSISSITGSMIRDYRDALKKLPSNLKKERRFKDKPIHEILKMDIKATLHSTTINKYLRRLRAMFTWAVQDQYIPVNPADGIQVPQSKKDKTRTHFTNPDLKAIFHSPEYKGDATFKHPYMFWAPLIALYTGMRNNEIAQLHVDDFKEIDGIPIIDITEEVTNPNSTDSKQLKKNTNSKRKTPIHPYLAHRINLLGYVQKLKAKGQVRLFPELKKGRDGYGREITRNFCGSGNTIGFLAKWGVKKPGSKQEKVFHSFRNTVCHTLLNKGVPEAMGAQITGHSIRKSAFGDYANEYTLEVLYKEAVLKMNFDEVIGLDHIRFNEDE